MKKILKILLAILIANPVLAQQTIPLYNGAIPNSIATPDKETSNDNNVHLNVTQPTLGIYLPSKETANGTAVIICPGGGYQGLW
ncbi:MAG: alpha/beta hydrolase, partial [Bacteroidota bacterium]|nr:alpha/beta hydrolase [Bacteroidota bacterium]